MCHFPALLQRFIYIFLVCFLSCNREIPAPVVKVEPNFHRAGELLELEINGVQWRFRYCPSGSFTMGTSRAEARTIKAFNEMAPGGLWGYPLGSAEHEKQYDVVITNGFWMAETETTQQQWESIMGDNPSHFRGDNLPVESVSWNDCQEFIKMVNEQADLKPGYKLDLPSEVQWEYACRAGTTTPFHFGNALYGDEANNDSSEFAFDLKKIGLITGIVFGFSKQGNFLGKTTPVGSYPANAWGLFDMHGNVEEWCRDIRGANPLRYVTRGGGYNSRGLYCRSAARSWGNPNNEEWDEAGEFVSRRGFRLVLENK